MPRKERLDPKIDLERWQKLSPFLDEALEREGSERTAWLDALRARDPELAHEVQQLLVELDALDAQEFLHKDPAALVMDSVALKGQALGAYRLESLLGRGGMGSVWLARRSDGHFEGKVAVKLLNLALVGRGGGEERFRREGRVLARLVHPNIARIIDAGITPAGQSYLVLEYIDGCDIERYCDERALPIEARIRLFLDVLAAVGHAHANLIVHRDIKPSNIYVTRDGVVKLLDFGVAKLLEDDESGAATRLTREGMRALTPQYAAPEQVLDAPITVATDVYALGVLLYALLSGRHPNGEASTSTLRQIRLLLETEPARLSEAASVSRAEDPTTLTESAAKRASTPQKLKRALQGDLDNIVARALKKDPQERYASVREFADDLKRYLRREPVLARGDNTWYRVRKFVARNRLPVIAGGAALAAIVATAAVALFEANAAETERDRALALSARDEAVADFLNVLITNAASDDKPVTVAEMLKRSEEIARLAYRDIPEHRAAVLGMLGSYYYTNEKHVRAEALLSEALSLVRHSTDSDLKRKLTCDHAVTLSKLGRVPDAVRILNEAVAEPQIGAQRSAQCLDYLTLISLEARDVDNALKFGNLALERLHRAPHPAPALEAELLGNIGFAEHLKGHNGVAERLFEHALAQFAQAGRDRGPDGLATRSNWAAVADGAGDPRRALELDEQVLQIVLQNDPAAPLPSTLLYNRARELELIGRYREGRDGFMRCLAETERSGAPANKVNCLFGLASSSHELGDLASADRYLATAFEIAAASLPSNSVPALRLRYLRGSIALTRKRLPEARSELTAVLAQSKSVYLNMDALRARAELELAEGRLADAQADAQQALNLAQVAQGDIPHSNRTGLAWLTLGTVLSRVGDAPRAADAFEAAVEHLSHTVDAAHPLLLRARQLARPHPDQRSGKRGSFWSIISVANSTTLPPHQLVMGEPSLLSVRA